MGEGDPTLTELITEIENQKSIEKDLEKETLRVETENEEIKDRIKIEIRKALLAERDACTRRIKVKHLGLNQKVDEQKRLINKEKEVKKVSLNAFTM